MTIKNYYISDRRVEEALTIDGKPFAELSEDELGNIRLRLADLLRKQPVNRIDLAYITEIITSSYGTWNYKQKTIQLSL